MAAALLVAVGGCANLGQYTWVDQYRDPQPPAKPTPYVLAPGDVVQVRVFNQEGMSARTRVRSDGKISLPFLNDVEAEGLEPKVLAQQLQVRLKDFINDPVVTVSVEEPRQMQIVVVGEVSHPGVIGLPPAAGVLPALVLAGGLTDFAHDDRIFVVRRDPAPARIRFTYRSLLAAGGAAGAFRLTPGDVVVVE
jgi:polysaccharide biosynthesis/export protein